MNSIMLAPLDALEASLNALVASLTTTPTFATAPTAAKGLLSADDALTSALTTLQKHQDNYATILRLRAEADRLHEQIQRVVRTCGDFRSEITRISPGILDDDEDDDTTNAGQDVNYETLLSFAARIGKHNAAAARRAEEDAVRHKGEARQKTIQGLENGNMHGTAQDGVEAPEPATLPPGAKEVLEARDAEVAMDRAYRGMAFPAADILRLGALGQLQLVREQGGEEAVAREVERMVRQSEGVVTGERGSEAEVPDVAMDAATQSSTAAARSGLAPRAAQSAGEKKKIVLDMWDGTDDDDDEA